MRNLFTIKKGVAITSLVSLLFSSVSYGAVVGAMQPNLSNSISVAEEFETHHPSRIILKLKPNLGMSEVLKSKGKPSVADLSGPGWGKLKAKHGINKIDRVFSGLQGMSSNKKSKITADKFAQRNGRSKSSASVPALENIYKLSINSKDDHKKVIDDLLANPDVESAELDYQVNALAMPNDPMYVDLWGLQATVSDAEGAWDISQGSGVTVAIIDSGVDYNHSDLRDNAWVNTAEIENDGIDNDANGYVDDYYGYDFNARDSDPLDENGHGTHVAGTVAAVGNNGVGVIGIAPQSKFMSIRGLNATGSGYTSDLAEAIYYAVDMGADVINNSWGGGGVNTALKDAIDYAHAMGVVVIAAAGNDNSKSIHYPSGYDNVVSVTAVDSAGAKASFSNYGTRVDVAAPGVEILSTMPEYSVYLNTSRSLAQGYDLLNGTSMASPHVAGQVALILSSNPTYSVEQVVDAITITSNAQIISDEYIGAGIINAKQSVSLVDPPSSVFLEITSPLYSADINKTNGIVGDVVATDYILYRSDEGPYTNNWTPIGNGTSGLDTMLGDFEVAGLPDGEYFIKLSTVGSDGFERSHIVKLRYDHELMDGWPKQHVDNFSNTRIIASSPIIANFDGVGGNEVLSMCDFTGCDIMLSRADGSTMPGWPQKIAGTDRGTPAVADIDNDGDLEIAFIAGYPGRELRILHHDGSEFIPPVVLEGNAFQGDSPMIGDINGDGTLNIVAATVNANVNNDRLIITALDLNGNVLSGWPFYFDGGDVRFKDAMAMADFDNDGAQEIVVSTGDYALTPRTIMHYLLDGSGNVQSGWPKIGEGYYTYRPAVGDIDLDGQLDIIAVDYMAGKPNFHRYDRFGNEAEGWPKSLIYTPSSAITLSDIDDNGTLEIIFQDSFSKVYVYDHTGALLPGWPAEAANFSGYVNPTGFESSIITGDVDGDGQIDLVFGNGNSEEVIALSNTGLPLPGFPKKMQSGEYNGISATPAVGDIDGDGDLDLVAGDTAGNVYAWDLANNYEADSWKWSQYGRDLSNTSYMNQPPMLMPIGTRLVNVGDNLTFTVHAVDASSNLSFSAEQLPIGATFDVQTHSFNWIPTLAQIGSSYATFIVGDGEYSVNEVVEIVVQNGVAPTFNLIGNKAVNEGALLQFTVGATDADGDSLTYSVFNLPSGAAFDSATKTFSWAPDFTQKGVYDQVTFEVSDGHHTASSMITITVNNVNNSPELNPIGDITAVEGALLSFTVAGSDPDGDLLSYTASGLPSGAVFNSLSGEFSWTAAILKGKNGNMHTVTFTTSDGEFSRSETITITVTSGGTSDGGSTKGGGPKGGGSQDTTTTDEGTTSTKGGKKK